MNAIDEIILTDDEHTLWGKDRLTRLGVSDKQYESNGSNGNQDRVYGY